MHNPLAKKIAHAKKEHDEGRNKKCHGKSGSYHARYHGQGNCHAGKCKKKYCDYHEFCHHDTKECNNYQACRKHVQPTHCITEEQKLW
eukprot:10225366-Ditylum_brightwellii.AAC.1